MTPVQMRRELARAALGGDVDEYVRGLLRAGLTTLVETKRRLRDAGLQAGLGARSKRSRYAATKLGRHGTVRIHLGQGLLTVHARKATPRVYMSPDTALEELFRIGAGNITALSKICTTLETARRRCYEIAEEGTRWLP